MIENEVAPVTDEELQELLDEDWWEHSDGFEDVVDDLSEDAE